MAITYRFDGPLTAALLSDVFARSGIRRPVGDLDRLQRMIDHASLILTAWDGDRLVGVARAVTDFSFCCYLSDLAVDRDYQQQGIGKALVRQVRERLGEEVMLLLLAAPEAMEYYPHIGFSRVENGWIIPRTR